MRVAATANGGLRLGGVDIEERSFVAKGAPQDDGQLRVRAGTLLIAALRADRWQVRGARAALNAEKRVGTNGETDDGSQD